MVGGGISCECTNCDGKVIHTAEVQSLDQCKQFCCTDKKDCGLIYNPKDSFSIYGSCGNEHEKCLGNFLKEFLKEMIPTVIEIVKKPSQW
ncbi:hypothetical protein GAMM_170050 [Gammaproteobacteria bacterium]